LRDRQRAPASRYELETGASDELAKPVADHRKTFQGNRAGRCHPDRASLPDDIINVPEAARRCGVNAETLYRLIRAGKFPPAVRLGAAIRVSVPRLECYLHGDLRTSA
jgi:excisionase family DNA binding protein